MMATWLHLTAVLLVMMIAELPSPTCGLLCECTADCSDGQDTCDAGDKGACYSQLITDISGQRTVLRKGCVADAHSVICAYRNSGAHKNMCCNDTELCNAEHFQDSIAAQKTTCRCVAARRCKNRKCSLRSSKDSCYTTIRRLGSIITYERGCKKKCTESHNQDEKTTCCHGNLCNTKAIPDEWPSPSSSSVVMTSTSYRAPQLMGTTSSSSPQQTNSPSTDQTTGIIEIPSFPTTEEPKGTTELTGRTNTQFICHCNQCTGGSSTCVADYACARYSMGGDVVTSCVNGEFTCKNKTAFNVNCCFEDYCNRPSSPTPGQPGPPCDDEDTDQSGCEPVVITSTPSTIKATSTRTTMATAATTSPTSTTKASPPPVGREKDTDNANEETIVVFYMFIVLLCICVIIMVAVLIVCGVIVYYYRNLVTKQTLSSTTSTVLESSIKEKSFTNSSPS